MADSVNVFVGNSVLLSGGNIVTTGSLTTDGVDEGVSNLYYTEARVNANATVVQNVADISTIQSEQTAQDSVISGIQTDLTDNYVDKTKAIIDVNTDAYSTGQWIYGTKAGINGGLEFIGICQTFPPTIDAHIKFIYRES